MRSALPSTSWRASSLYFAGANAPSSFETSTSTQSVAEPQSSRSSKSASRSSSKCLVTNASGSA